MSEPIRVVLDSRVYLYEGEADYLAGHYEKDREPVEVKRADAYREAVEALRVIAAGTGFSQKTAREALKRLGQSGPGEATG